MTEISFALTAAVIVGAAVIGWWVGARRQPARTDATTNRDSTDSWLMDASEAARAGRLLMDQLEPLLADGPSAAAGGSSVPDPAGSLDDLTHRLAELAVSAPTTMDERVCRNAAVRSQALGDALRARSGVPRAASDRFDVSRRELTDLRAECQVALRDLTEHVDLL